MKKRLLLLDLLRKLLIGDQPTAAEPAPAQPTEPTFTLSAPEPVPSSEPPAPPALAIDELPEVSEEIRDLLSSADWEEVNQGLELLGASHQTNQLRALIGLIDLTQLQIRDQQLWDQTLGIAGVHTLNAVAKLASIAGVLGDLCRVSVNAVFFADTELVLDLSLLAEAKGLEELTVNGISLENAGTLSGFNGLRRLVLMSDSIDWDSDDDVDCLSGMEELHSLTVASWPWADLSPLQNSRTLEHLSIRGGDLENLAGIDSLTSLRHLRIDECYAFSSVDGVEVLTQLEELALSNVSIDDVDALSNLLHLRSLILETSETVDLTPLGALQALETAEIDCSEARGLSAMAACGKLVRLKLSSVPDCRCGDSRLRLGSGELSNLMNFWKPVHKRRNKVCTSYAEASDIGVFLLGLNLLECLSQQIDLDTFRQRLQQLNQRHGEQLLSRCHWPWVGTPEQGYSRAHPVGQWIGQVRAAGAMSERSCAELSAVLAEVLPRTPQR